MHAQVDGGHGGEAAVHLRVDRDAAEGGDHDASDAVRQPVDDDSTVRLSAGRREADHGGLAAVEPHVRRQPQLQHGAVRGRHDVSRCRAAAARPVRADAGRDPGSGADAVSGGAEGVGGAGAGDCGRTRRSTGGSTSGCGCGSMPRRRCRSRCGTSWTRWRRRRPAGVVPMITGLGSTETAPMGTAPTGRARRPGDIGLPVPGIAAEAGADGRQAGAAGAAGRASRRAIGATRRRREAAFDAEGFYCMGDAVAWIDPARAGAGAAVRRADGGGLQADAPAPGSASGRCGRG